MPEAVSASAHSTSLKMIGGAIRRLQWPLLGLAVILLFNLFCSPGFFRIEHRDGAFYGSLIDILNRAAPVALISLGMTLALATGGVDLSVGSVAAISGAVAALVIHWPGGPVIPAIFFALCIAALAGAWNGALISYLGVQPIVATLILMVAGRGIAQLLTGGQIITFQNASLAYLGGGFFLGFPFPIALVLLAYVLLGSFSRLTAFGLFVEATGDNPIASRYAGLPARQTTFIAYVICGLCAGLAGLILMSDIKAADANNAGLYMEMDAILASVIGGNPMTGGRFNLLGALVGAVLIQSLTTTILTRGIPVQFTLVVKGFVIIAVCLLQSEPMRRALSRRGAAA